MDTALVSNNYLTQYDCVASAAVFLRHDNIISVKVSLLYYYDIFVDFSHSLVIHATVYDLEQ